METTAPSPVAADAKPKKRSSVRHTRAIQRDRQHRPTSAPSAEAVAARLTEIVHPLTLAQVSYFQTLGLRARVLTLPVMMGLVLGLLWVEPLRELTQQALAQRLRTLPAELFERVLKTMLPVLHQRWQTRHRPSSPGRRHATRRS